MDTIVSQESGKKRDSTASENKHDKTSPHTGQQVATQNNEASNNPDDPERSNQNTYVRGFRLITITTAVMVSVLLVALDINIIATAVPRIASTFNSLHDIGWYGAAYLLAVMALQPTYGTIYTHFSLKWTLVAALLIFGIGSIVCALATSSSALIVSRSVQGMGGAGIMGGGLNIVADLAPQQKRPLFMALIASVYAVAGAAGPVIGGIFVDSKLTWRFAFWINLPLVFIACVILIFFYKEPQKDRGEKTLKDRLKDLQIHTSLLLSGTIVCLFFALQRGGVTHPWSSTQVWPFLLAFAVGLTIFVILQIHQGERAMIPSRVIGHRTVYTSSIYALTLLIASSTISYYLPFYFQAAKGVSASRSGIYILPFVVTNSLVTFVTAALISKFGPYAWAMWTGAAILTIGCGTLSTLSTDSSVAAWIGYQLIASIGLGLGIQVPFTAVQSFGGALALSIDQNIFNVSLRRFLGEIQPSVDVDRVVSQDPVDVVSGVAGGQVGDVREAYARALRLVLIVPVVASGVAFLAGVATEKGSVKADEHVE
ncbi:unnamed protein product [Periconia digitata]|uniref:Major facilitator superfamily (MFS) profile domain-containing protein n=1 Tax=Periconia digitata TaxID=1303443 RepID=A0A9W4XGW6_9PLEO|nr:unnamed protein product [Periconia digitata]